MTEKIAREVQARFLRYVQVWTTSDSHEDNHEVPSTRRQWDLLRLLQRELEKIGVPEISLTDKGFLIGRIPAHPSATEAPVIGFMAHVDTSEEVSGEAVFPQVHSSYDGNPILLKEGIILDPLEYPSLLNYKGDTIITSDGTTLLGADDKAGVAEIMTAASFLMTHPESVHGEIELIFTSDEETGRGMHHFPIEALRSRVCYTLDGGEEGTWEKESFNAATSSIHFHGESVHPGTGRGKLINAISMASAFLSLLPRNESPEATDGRFGNYWPSLVSGTMSHTTVRLEIRDFDRAILARRIEALEHFGKAIEAAFPGGRVLMNIKNQYENMRRGIEKDPRVCSLLEKAISSTGTVPREILIRGGTDGAFLTAQGIPSPNIFAGGVAMHSKKEWVALSVMSKAVQVILNLSALWSKTTSQQST